MTATTTELIERLQLSLNETVETLAALTDADLGDASDHICATGGTVRDLLTHNIDHDRMHAGQLFGARYLLKHMQKGEVHRLITETIRARVEMIAALIGLPDDLLDASIPDEGWTIREMVEHTIYWERHSVDDIRRRRLAGLVEQRQTSLPGVEDPLYGPLPQSDLADSHTPTPVPEPKPVKAEAAQTAK